MSRPSKYKPEYCEQATEYLSQGHSITALAGRFRVNRDTVFEWRKRYPEFDEAVKVGIAAAVAFWEDILIENSRDGKNCGGAIFGLKNRASDDWRDKQEHEHKGDLVVNVVRFADNASE